MLLSEILTRLCEGEFADLNLGYMVDGKPQAEHYGKLVRHVDMGLLELYKRFPILIKEAHIQQYEHIYSYELSEKYAQTNTESTEPIKYLIDTVFDRFNDSEFLMIETLYNEIGECIPINDKSECYSMYTQGFRTIQVPYPNNENSFLVHYRASHGLLDTTAEPNQVEVNLPYTHLVALLYYTASRAVGKVDPNQSTGYIMHFEEACNKIRELGFSYEDNTPTQQFSNGGWV